MTATMAALFLAFGTLLWGLVHAYLGWRLVRPTRWPRWARTLAWSLLGLSTVLWPGVFVARFAGLLSPLVTGLGWIAYLAMGYVAVLVILVLARDLVWLTWRLGGRVAGALKRSTEQVRPVDTDRRRLVFNGIGAGAAVLAGGNTVAGLLQVRQGARVRHVKVPVVGLPASLAGYRIAHLTDVHVSELIGRADVERAVELLMAQGADAIAVTGDLADGYPDELARDMEPFADLRAPDGVWFVTGNHEYYWDHAGWLRAIRGLGWDVLHNEHRVVTRGEGRLVVAGVPDPEIAGFVAGERDDPGKALAGAPDGAPRILLAHRPQQVAAASAAGVDLQLSGHTHGGQFYPWKPLVRLDEPYISGLHLHHRTWIYVCNGYGFWGPPNRAGIPAEIGVVELVPDPTV